jgi:uncharacterized protein (TIGR04255 family)
MVKYNNPPIIEAVCEFRFGTDTKWDMTIPGIMYGEIQKEFPHVEQRTLQDINLPEDTSGKGTRINTITLARFLSEDKKRLIQVGPRILSINQLKPYGTWPEFKSLIEYALNTLSQKVVLNSVQRIGLRYVNRIEIPEKTVNIEDYFKFRPFLGERLHGYPYTSFMVGCIFPLYGDRDTCKVELTNGVPETSDASAFMLDIDYSLIKPQDIAANQSLEWVESAHGKVEDFFEGCISDSLRDLFGGVN